MNPVTLRCVGPVMLCVLLALLIALPQILSAQVSNTGVSLEQLLNADGTLRLTPGQSVSIDPRGWEVAVDPNGTPRFTRTTAADTADVHWDNRFVGPYGVDGTVNAIAMIGPDIYFGGSFAGTDKIIASNIVKWNAPSGTWSGLGAGVDDVVNALAVIGTNLYVGGAFANAGGTPARHIAMWDGSAWSTLGTSPNDGASNTVYALSASGTNLFVGGSFTTAGSGVTVNRVARWSGTSWTALGTGVNSTVYALATMGSDLFAAGSFTSAGGNPANRIARWTGSAWATLGTTPNDGVGGTVYALAAAPPYLYVGGAFTTAGAALPANYIARWNGTDWAALGNGFTTADVRAILVSGPSVYAAGKFTATGILTANRIAMWDTASSSWSALNAGVNSSIFALLQNGADLYAAGEFTSFTNTSTPAAANHIARWSGSSWQALGTVVSNSVDGAFVYGLAVSGADVYIGGSFITAASINANNVVKYNSASNTWTALGSGPDNGVNGPVTAIAVNGTDVYVGGLFTSAGGSPATSIAKWNGSAWSALGTSPNEGIVGIVGSILVSGSNVFVGGLFTTAGGITANYIARWSGTAWSALGTGTNNSIVALAVIGSDLYAGGTFTTAGGSPANHVARWNGSSWSTLGTAPNDGVNGNVASLLSVGATLYVGGAFDHAAGATIAASHVARWNGSVWSPMGNGVSGGAPNTTVAKFAESGGSIYATGAFTTTGIISANNIARWDTAGGGSWSPLGSGLSNWGLSLAIAGGDVYVGGTFTMAGSKPSFKFARWNPALVTSSVGRSGDVPRTFLLEQNYPNPFNPATTIGYELSSSSRVTLKVYDLLGRQIATLADGIEQAGPHSVRFDASGLASGVYFYRLTAGDKVAQQKMILLR